MAEFSVQLFDFDGDMFPTNFTFLRRRSWFCTLYVSDISILIIIIIIIIIICVLNYL